VSGNSDGDAQGVYGQTGSNTSAGVEGYNFGSGPGVYGVNLEFGGIGVHGVSSSSHAGVQGDNSSGGPGVYGKNTSTGSGVYGTSEHGTGVHGVGGSGAGVEGDNAGIAPGVYGKNSGSGIGVEGVTNTAVNGNPAVAGFNLGSGPGIVGYSQGSGSIGTGGTTDLGYGFYGGATGSGTGVLGYSVGGAAVWGAANGVSNYAGLFTGGAGVLVYGALTATGPKSAAVKAADGKLRRMYSVESPESWFEDVGSGQLSNGSVTVQLEPGFAGVVKTEQYRVFLTPAGDCNGLYVSNKTPSGFTVRELKGGTSSIAFDYRVIAKRKDIEGARLEHIEEPAMPALPKLPEPPTPPPTPPGQGG
jgi:hypothetical protein